MLGHRTQRDSASFTAAGVAAVRAEMDRPSSPDGDTQAARRLAESLRVPFPVNRLPIVASYIEGRTRFFDHAVATAAQEVHQIVIIGAGYDDRSLRFRTPGVLFIEVDHPATQRDKRARLETLGIDASDIQFVSVNLAESSIREALSEVVDPDGRVVYVCEAVVPYLRYERIHDLLAGLSLTPAKAATLYLDAPVRPDHPFGRLLLGYLRLSTAVVGEPIHTILTASELESLLVQTGWREESRTTGRDLGMPRVVADSRYLELTRI